MKNIYFLTYFSLFFASVGCNEGKEITEKYSGLVEPEQKQDSINLRKAWTQLLHPKESIEALEVEEGMTLNW